MPPKSVCVLTGMRVIIVVASWDREDSSRSVRTKKYLVSYDTTIELRVVEQVGLLIIVLQDYKQQ